MSSLIGVNATVNRSKLNWCGADATILCGQYVVALCHKEGVDIISCDTGRYLQVLRECVGASQVLWSSHLAHLAVLAHGIIHIYTYSPRSSALSPNWNHENQIQISPVNTHFMDINITLSFRYPWILVAHSDILQLMDCKSGVVHLVTCPYGVPNLAKLSASGLTFSASYLGSSRIDFMEVHVSGCTPIAYMEHASEVRSLLWRPSCSQDRELILGTDVHNLIRLWAVEYRKPLNATDSPQIEINLILETGDYVGKPIRVSWLAHGLATASETSFLAESPVRDRSKRSQTMPPMPSGSWFTVLDERGVVRMYCISSHSFSKHIECSLKGHGPCLEPFPGHQVLAVYSAGRFTSTGSDRPLAVELAVVYDMDPSASAGVEGGVGSASAVTTRHNLTMAHLNTSAYECNRRLIRLVSGVTDRRPSGFVVLLQSQRDLIVEDETRDTVIGPYTNHLPTRYTSGWRLKTWETYSLDGGASHQSRAVPKTFRAMETPWATPEVALWNWAHRLKDSTHLPETPVYASELQFAPLDITSAASGFEVTHDLLRAVWLAQPPPISAYGKRTPGRTPVSSVSASGVASGESPRVRKMTVVGQHHHDSAAFSRAASSPSERTQQPFPQAQLLITLQKKQLGSYVVAVWMVDRTTASPTQVSLGPAVVDPQPAVTQVEQSMSPVIASSVSGAGSRDEEQLTSLDNIYECPITPDPHFGLGLRLDIVDGKILVESYKRNPLTMKPMPAEECGIVSIGDELLAINGNILKGSALSDVIQTIRAVVQNARGSDVILQLRSGQDGSGYPDSPTNPGKGRGVSDAPEVRWYGVGGGGGRLGGSLHGKQSKATAETTTGDLIVDVPTKPSWQLLNSWSLDDCLAVDLVSGSLGFGLGDIDGAQEECDGILMVVAAVRRVLSNTGAHLEVCLWELTRDACFAERGAMVLRIVAPWGGPEPHVLQLWRIEAEVYILSGMVAGGQMVIHQLVCGNETDSSAQHREETKSRVPLVRLVSSGHDERSVSTGWQISQACVFQISGADSGLDFHMTAAGGGPEDEVHWMPLCAPLEDGRRLIVLGHVGSKKVVLARISNKTLAQPATAGDDYRHRAGSGGTAGGIRQRTGSGNAVTSSTAARSLSIDDTLVAGMGTGAAERVIVADVVQVLDIREPVRWARWSGENALQVCAGSTLIIFSRAVGSERECWDRVNVVDFNSSDRPTSLASTPLDTPTPWFGTSVGVANTLSYDLDMRIAGEVVASDWHPVTLLLNLFSVSSFRLNENYRWPVTLAVAMENIMSHLASLFTALDVVRASPGSFFCTKLVSADPTGSISAEAMEVLVQRIVPVARQILHRPKPIPGHLSSSLLDPALKTLRPADVVTLAVTILHLQSSLDVSDFKRFPLKREYDDDSAIEAKAIGLGRLKRLDLWAVHAVSLQQSDDILQNLIGGSVRPVLRGAAVANALVSSSQKLLFDQLLGEELLAKGEGEGPGMKKGLQFGVMWWARNQAGKDMEGEQDILRILTDSMVAFWLHDLSPLLPIIESRAVHQYKDQRDSMQIFLEMLAIGKADKLLLLSKTDKNILGKQLQNLLTFDFASERGRNAARKNAYALLRLQRYRHAAAVFLCAEPPMLREATRIIVKNLDDPFMAFLIARLVEARRGPLARKGGLVLGPVARHLLVEDIVPLLKKAASNHLDTAVSTTGASGNPVLLRQFPVKGIDAAMLCLACAFWLQDHTLLTSSLTEFCANGIFDYSLHSTVDRVRHCIGVSGSIRFLCDQTNCPQLVPSVAASLDSFLEDCRLHDWRYLSSAVGEGTTEGSGKTNAFLVYCKTALNEWVVAKESARVARYGSTSSLTPAAVATSVSRPDDDEVDQELRSSLKKLNTFALSNALEEKFEMRKTANKGFNFAMTSTATSSTTDPTVGDEKAVNVDSFEVPLPRALTHSMADEYSSPQQKTLPSALDLFDVPVGVKKPSTPSMLDAFDVPTQATKPKPQPVPSALDMFDVPAQAAKPKPQPVPSALDMFDVPAQAAKPKPPPVPSALDMFDGAPGNHSQRISRVEVEVNSDSPGMLKSPGRADGEQQSPSVSSKADGEALNEVVEVEEEDGRVAAFQDAFTSNDLTTTGGEDSTRIGQKVLLAAKPSVLTGLSGLPPPISIPGRSGGSDRSSLSQKPSYPALYNSILRQACRHAVLVRCQLELLASLGCPSMGHPLAIAQNVVGFIQVMLVNITESRSEIAAKTAAFQSTIEKLAAKFSGYIIDSDIAIFSEKVKSVTSSDSYQNDDNLRVQGKNEYLFGEEPGSDMRTLCHFLLGSLKLRRTLDCPALVVLLHWILGNIAEARAVLVSNVVTVVELIPAYTDRSDPRNMSVMSCARQIMFGCLATQLQFIMSIADKAGCGALPAYNVTLDDAVISLTSLAVRLALTFSCLDFRYDVILSVLKHPPKFQATLATDGSIDSAFVLGLEEDPGVAYFRKVTRVEAVEILQAQEQGVFLLRPHDTQTDVIFLSFRGRPEDGVKHAIVRKELGDRGAVSFRCGRVGPCISLEETLRTIAKVLPSGLNFDKKLPSTNVLKASLSTHSLTDSEAVQSCDPNADLWDALAKIVASTVNILTKSNRGRRISLKRPMQSQLIMSMSATADQPDHHFSDDSQDDEEEDEDTPGDTGSPSGRNGVDQLGTQSSTLTAASSATSMGTSSTLDALTNATATDGDCGASLGEESLIWSNNEEEPVFGSGGDLQGWTTPLEPWRLCAQVQSVLHTLAVKAIQRQLATHIPALKTLIESEPQTELRLRISVTTRLHRRLPQALLPSPPRPRNRNQQVQTLTHPAVPPTIPEDEESDQKSPPGVAAAAAGVVGEVSVEDAQRARRREGEKEVEEHAPHVGALESLLGPLTIYVCLSERVLHSSLAPPLPPNKALLLPREAVAGEALVQALLHDKRGAGVKVIKVTAAPSGGSGGVLGDREQSLEAVEMADVLNWLISRQADEEVRVVTELIAAEDQERERLRELLAAKSAEASHLASAADKNELSGMLASGMGIGVGLGYEESAAAAAPPTSPAATNPAQNNSTTASVSVSSGLGLGEDSRQQQAVNERIVKWLFRHRLMCGIQSAGSAGGIGLGQYQGLQGFIRYEDPWEVSVVHDQGTVLTSAKLGRSWLGPVSAHSANTLIEIFAGEQGLDITEEPRDKDAPASQIRPLSHRKNQGQGFIRLWESLRAEAWLVMTISTALEQSEREKGGSAAMESGTANLTSQDAYHGCLSRHLYRNALFSRVAMPHRFAAVLQVDIFGLKDLAPQKFRTPSSSATMEVYSVIRLVRNSNKKQDPRKTWADTVLTQGRRVEPEYLWRDQAVMRFPLPEGVLSVGPFADGCDRSLLQPPSKLQLSVYETRFFSDHKLGDLELPLSSLTDERALRDWLPLSSDKGAAWFVHVQLQLRFLLMAVDSAKEGSVGEALQSADVDSLTSGVKKYRNSKLRRGRFAFPRIRRIGTQRRKSGEEGGEAGADSKPASSLTATALSGMGSALNPFQFPGSGFGSGFGLGTSTYGNAGSVLASFSTNNNNNSNSSSTSPQNAGGGRFQLSTIATGGNNTTGSLNSTQAVSASSTTNPANNAGAGSGKFRQLANVLGTMNPVPSGSQKSRFRPSAISRLEELGDFF